MAAILDRLQDCELRRFETGEIILEQGGRTDCLYFLVEGTAEVMKDGVRVATASQPGVVFGEMSVLLGVDHTATVRALAPCALRVVTDPHQLLRTSPAVCFHVCELLARRLDALNRYLVDVKHQFEGHDHLGMVDEVLEALMHRQPRARVRPRESTIRHGEPAE